MGTDLTDISNLSCRVYRSCRERVLVETSACEIVYDLGLFRRVTISDYALYVSLVARGRSCEDVRTSTG